MLFGVNNVFPENIDTITQSMLHMHPYGIYVAMNQPDGLLVHLIPLKGMQKPVIPTAISEEDVLEIVPPTDVDEKDLPDNVIKVDFGQKPKETPSVPQHPAKVQSIGRGKRDSKSWNEFVKSLPPDPNRIVFNGKNPPPEPA